MYSKTFASGHKMKKFLLALCLLFSAVAVAQSPQLLPSAASASSSTEVMVLRAQLETSKQFQDSFMSMAQWTLGSAIAVALSLGAFAWHTNKTNYERDREAIQREAKSLATELRAELRLEVQAESEKLAVSLGVREASLKEAVERSLAPRFSTLSVRVGNVEREALDLKEVSLERAAEDALEKGIHRTAIRKYCELIRLHVERKQDDFYAADILDRLREIAKNPNATIDADAVTIVVSTVQCLPTQHHAACEPLVALFKQRLA